MLEILGLLAAGTLVGFLLRKSPPVIRISSVLLNVSILLLLFFLGYRVGANRAIIEHFDRIGLLALGISLIAVLFCLLLGRIFLSYYQKSEK